MSCVYCNHDLAETHDIDFTALAWIIECAACAKELDTHRVVCAVHPRASFR